MDSGDASNSFDEYDKECTERYGIKTCILVETDKRDIFELRMMDKISLKSRQRYILRRSNLFEVIPKMLFHKYTVVIVEQCPNSKEITAVHHPVQSQLTIPPIIQ